jgi:hypothetical protein
VSEIVHQVIRREEMPSVLALALAVFRGQMTEAEAVRILREQERSRSSDD